MKVASGFSAQVGQVDIGFTAVDDGVGVFAGSFGRQTIRHGHLFVGANKQDTRHNAKHTNESHFFFLKNKKNGTANKAHAIADRDMMPKRGENHASKPNETPPKKNKKTKSLSSIV